MSDKDSREDESSSEGEPTPPKLMVAVLWIDESTAKLVPGRSATPGFQGDTVTLEEGVDAKYSPLARPVRWRIERRGSRLVRCSTFVLTRAEISRHADNEVAKICAPFHSDVEVTLEILMPPPFAAEDEMTSSESPGTIVRLTEDDKASAARLATLDLAERWFESPTTDSSLRGLFWKGPSIPICAACLQPTDRIGGVFSLEFMDDRGSPVELYFGICVPCAPRHNPPAELDRLVQKVMLMALRARPAKRTGRRFQFVMLADISGLPWVRLSVGEGVAPDFKGDPEVLEEWEGQSPFLHRTVAGRLERRGKHIVGSIVFGITSEEAIKLRAEKGRPNVPLLEGDGEITVETDVSDAPVSSRLELVATAECVVGKILDQRLTPPDESN